MKYIDKTMMINEHLIFRAHLHWIIFFWPAFLLFLCVVYGLAGQAKVMGGAFFLFAFTGLRAFILYSTSEFGVTNKRVILKSGFIRRNTVETLLSKIEGVAVNQGIFGRVLNYGAVSVTGTGGTKGSFLKMAAPLEFRKKIQESIDKPSMATQAV